VPSHALHSNPTKTGFTCTFWYTMCWETSISVGPPSLAYLISEMVWRTCVDVRLAFRLPSVHRINVYYLRSLAAQGLWAAANVRVVLWPPWLSIMLVVCTCHCDTISSYRIYASCFCSPWCAASTAKCLLLWHHLLGKMAVIRTFSQTDRFNFIRITRQTFTTQYAVLPHNIKIIWWSQIKAKFHYASWFGAGSKLVRAKIWPIIYLASSELARASRFATKFHYAIWFEVGSKLVRTR